MSSILIETYDAPGAGPSVAVKDCIDIAGSTTRCGSRAFADAPPARRHAQVVQALVDGGYRIVGKASMHELAYGMTGLNDWTGHVDNPLFPGLIPGGSSSGSAAAVAAGLVDIALGTDTGGSVRMPAACCGVIGFKPSFARLSREGVAPAATTLDCVGLLARAMAPIEQAMARMDDGFVAVDAGNGVRIATIETTVDPQIDAAVARALERAGVFFQTCQLPLLEDAFQAGVVQMAAEAYCAYGHLIDSGLLGSDVEQRLRGAPALATPERLAWAQSVKQRFSADVDALLDRFDAIALPTLPGFPPAVDALGDAMTVLRLSSLVRPFNLSGHPAISMPVATLSDGPAAIQLVARRGGDARLCAIARLFEAMVPITHDKEEF